MRKEHGLSTAGEVSQYDREQIRGRYMKMICSQEQHIINLRLQELEHALNRFEDIVAAESNKYHVANDYPNILIKLAGKTIWTFREILCLCSSGFPEGALSLARNLYEQSITLAFFNKVRRNADFQDYVDDYYIDAEMQRTRVLKWEAKYSNNDAQQAQRYENELQRIKSSAHRKGKGDYWWTGHNSFSGVVEYLISTESDVQFSRMMARVHIVYKRACASLHAGSLGNNIRLGVEPSFAGVDNTAKAQGHELPLCFSTYSFILIVGVICHELKLDGADLLKEFNNLAVFYMDKWHNDLGKGETI